MRSALSVICQLALSEHIIPQAGNGAFFLSADSDPHSEKGNGDVLVDRMVSTLRLR